MLINCGNYFNENSLNQVCRALEKGEKVEVYIDCIGHSRNNNEQEAYKEALLQKYGDKLSIESRKGGYSNSYLYFLQG